MKSYRPTTPSRRQMTTVSYDVLTKTRPHKPLLIKVSDKAGRNHHGRITMRHQGGGNKKLYRLVDFKQMKVDVPGRVETIEYDPYRTAFIALVVYKDGDRRYILAPKDLKVGDAVLTAPQAVIYTGNRLKLKNIPIGYQVYNVELQPGRGGQIARSAGSYAEVLGQEGKYSVLKMSSGEVRKVVSENYASLGQVSNSDWNLTNIGKAGRSRWLGIRPTVRGNAMNPVDHPHGGGEGRQGRGLRRAKSIWGKPTGKGQKTRRPKKYSNVFIVSRRRVGKRK